MLKKATIQIVALKGDTVNYTPKDFPTVITDAMLVRFEGDILIVHNGWEYREVQPEQVQSIIPAKRHAITEAGDSAAQEYDSDQWRGSFDGWKHA